MFFSFLRVRIAPFKDIFSRQYCVLPDCTGYRLASQTVKKNTGVGVQYGVCVRARLVWEHAGRKRRCVSVHLYPVDICSSPVSWFSAWIIRALK